MAQSATKDSSKSPLGIQPFWEKATLEPPIRWEFWRIQLKLAILAREGIEVDIILVDPPEHVLLPPEPAYEDAVDNPTAQSERDRRTRNEQAKTAWKSQCQRVITVGILCGDKPWKLCDRKASSLMYLSLGMEGRRVFNSKNSTVNLKTISTKDLWDVLNTTFIRIHNITFDRYLFLTREEEEIRDCVLQDDEARCKEVSTYIHSFWKDLHVKSGCLCVDQRVAIPNPIKEAVLESIHMTHPGSWGMISLSQYAWWPYMHREILAKTSDCVPCTDIGKNLKPIIPKSKWHPHKACQEPNEEIQIDFGVR